MAILLSNAQYLNPETFEIKKCHILVQNDARPEIEFLDRLPEIIPDTQLDCSGMLVTRAFGCAHHHAYSALACGMPAPKVIPSNFREILEYVWWTLDKCLDEEMIETSALVTAIACAKNGVSCVIDHHASPNSISHSLNIIANAFSRVGISHLLCYEISDRDGISRAMKGLETTETYLSHQQGLVGLHASFTVSEETLLEAVQLARIQNAGIHIHVAEDEYDQQHCTETYGKRVVQRLADAGALDFPKTILAHCLHINENERRLIKNSPVWVVQNPESNLNNKVGAFQSAGLGPNILLGTDGMHSDMLRSAKMAFFTGSHTEAPSPAEVYSRFRNIHSYFNKNNFAGGKTDLVVLDYNNPTPLTSENFPGHFIFGMESKHVRHVISQGKLIVKDRNIQCINEAEIMERARILSLSLWNKMQKS